MAADGILNNEKERRKRILGFGFLAVIAVLLLSPYPLLMHLQQTQENMVIQAFGDGVDQWIAGIASSISRATGIIQAAQSARGFWGQRLDVIALGVYIVSWRVMYALLALSLAAPLLAAAVWDGLMNRRIAQWRYEYTSNRLHYLSRGAIGWFVDVLLLLLVFPLPMPPEALVVVMFLLGGALHQWSASFQKR
ncbi:DUF4400 domain-containing protein [Acidihalobacter ferrooxydans]|uniref:DUF4400 domain-containing protein n=1 Tax=Acidihalobacter ferrooxydans TaxID=1765967 RepID=A0A1P8UFL2_9GAMM|nr:DUF4400 domain-containing protein [Acidihalobacter ferrooxydans]APZ42637.1 hypothetical protein BW247_05600 [Acidihalobacter ferrooxydans]